MHPYPNLEERVKEVGLQIYSLIGDQVPSLFDQKRWKGKIMEWAMKDEAFKVQLFRFVDVLPCLKTDELVVRLLNEYFSGLENTPFMLRQGLGWIPGKGILPYMTARATRKSVEALAAQFIAGRDPEDALTALKRLNDDGIAFSLDLLGEEVLSETEASEYAARYLKLLTFLSPKVSAWKGPSILRSDDQGPIPLLDISLKVSSFYSQLDPVDWEGSIENAKKGVAAVIKTAQEAGASVTLDMESYYLKDLSIAIFEAILEEHTESSFAGIALQAYLRETKQDLLGIIDWAKKNNRRITVRLVKGAYWDYETVINRQKGWPIPVFVEKGDTDLNYEDLTRILLENTRYVRPAIATHNIRSISHAIAVADSLNLRKDAFEFQMIYGMAEPVRNALQNLGYRVRVYTPLGELIPGMAYLIRRLLENTSNESFLTKSFLQQQSFEELIKAPRFRDPENEPESEADAFRNEPPVDFSKAHNRDKMIQALAGAKKGFDKTYPFIIGGEEVETEAIIESRNPARPSEIVGRVATGNQEHAEKAVQIARNAWSAWSRIAHEERAGFLFRAAQEMRNRRYELAAIEVYEVGKTWKESDGDVTEAIDYLEYYGREMIRLGSAIILGDYPGEQNEYFYEPKGVGTVISPWNFPLAIPTGMVSAGIVTGNCVIFKPSGLSPICGWMLADVFRSVGLPAGVLQFVPGPGDEVGEYLVSHPGIDFIAFTGSKDVGLGIIKHAGETVAGQKNVKSVIAEMGGKNAIIVDETADLDEAVMEVLESALGFQGQKCSACSRVIIIGDAFDEFCGRLRAAMDSMKIGPPEDPGNHIGPLIDEAALRKVRRYIEIGEKEGKPLLMRKATDEGYFVGPAIIVDASPDSVIAQEEIFGPFLTILRADNIDRAIDVANNTQYALTGGIFSRSPGNIEKVRYEFRVGNLYINRKITGALVGRQPFGGFGMSGVGSKAGGPDYLLRFMNIRSISENTLRRGFAPTQ
jgi:RHH-type transcriptional regulator, proline utilization regulon repressor / proline dehydrogenase / delta 1-pyrroline-5-carboxylate dehydrogenase